MLYYTHNVVGAVNLIEACRKHNLKNVRLQISAAGMVIVTRCRTSAWHEWCGFQSVDPATAAGVQQQLHCVRQPGVHSSGREAQATGGCHECMGKSPGEHTPVRVGGVVGRHKRTRLQLTCFGSMTLQGGLCVQAVSPYGRTKLIIEDMFRDLFAAEKDWRIILLRYFNPVGAHPSGQFCRETNLVKLLCIDIVYQVLTHPWCPAGDWLACWSWQARLGNIQWASRTT